MFGWDDALAVAGGALGLYGAASRPKGNPNAWAMDKGNQYMDEAKGWLDTNNPFYTQSTAKYFNSLNKTLNASSPGTQGLLAMQAARGGEAQGSNFIANQQRQQIQLKNADSAGQSAQQFNLGMYGQGIGAYEHDQSLAAQMYGLYGQGQMAKYENEVSYSDNLMKGGFGLLARYAGRPPAPTSGSSGFSNFQLPSGGSSFQMPSTNPMQFKTSGLIPAYDENNYFDGSYGGGR